MKITLTANEFDFDNDPYRKLPEVSKRRDPRKMDVDYTTRQVIDKLDEWNKAKDVSEQIDSDPTLDAPETKRGRLEEESAFSPIAAEAVRILNTLTPEQEAEWINAFYPEYDILKQDALSAQIKLTNPKHVSECMDDIVRALGEKPEFAHLTQLTPEEEANLDAPDPTEDAVEDAVSAGVGEEVPSTPVVAKTRSFVLTKQAWLEIGKKKNWL